jgi:hypothetical protein
MSDPDFVDRMNREHFGGGLSPGFLDEMRRLPTERADVKAFIDRMFRFMDRASMTARDLSPFQGAILGSLLGRIHPGAWNGRVPPITVKGRHRKIDELIADNRYLGRRTSGSMLDLGCGFPPETTLDSADRLAGWTIHGADPSMPASMVRSYERPGLTFGVGGIGEVDIVGQDVVRCFNVMCYFDDDFREKALAWFASVLADGGILLVGGDWAYTLECRFFLYQREGHALRPREFSFGLDNVVPLGLVPFFALHDEDRGLTLLARLLSTLRADRAFRDRYYELTDRLRAENGICPRGDDGFFGSVEPDLDPDDLWRRAADMAETLAAELGPDAVAILERAGWSSRVNEIGLVSVALS